MRVLRWIDGLAWADVAMPACLILHRLYGSSTPNQAMIRPYLVGGLGKADSYSLCHPAAGGLGAALCAVRPHPLGVRVRGPAGHGAVHPALHRHGARRHRGEGHRQGEAAAVARPPSLLLPPPPLLPADAHASPSLPCPQVLCCLATLVQLGLLSRHAMLDKTQAAAPLLLHPSSSIRHEATRLMSAVARALSFPDSDVFLVPLLRPFLRYDLLGSEATGHDAIAQALQTPVSRAGLHQALIRTGRQASSSGHAVPQRAWSAVPYL